MKKRCYNCGVLLIEVENGLLCPNCGLVSTKEEKSEEEAKYIG